MIECCSTCQHGNELSDAEPCATCKAFNNWSEYEPDSPEGLTEKCGCCGHLIDPDTCHCGDPVWAHGFGTGHSFVPMGCTCGYHDAKDRKAPGYES